MVDLCDIFLRAGSMIFVIPCIINRGRPGYSQVGFKIFILSYVNQGMQIKSM